MNKKGFAITTIVYAILILLTLSSFIVLAILRSDYSNEKNFVNDVREEINTCLSNGNCNVGNN